MFESIASVLIPDYIKIKARFFPVITIDPKKETFFNKILQPKVYIVKGDNIFRIDPITKTVYSVSPEELKQTGMTIIDFVVFGAMVFLLYQGLGLFLKKASKYLK